MGVLKTNQASPQVRLSAEPIHRWMSDGTTVFSEFFRRMDGSYLLRFHEWADFEFSPDDETVVATPCQETTQDTLEHLFLSQVRPLHLSTQGRLVLHAGAVAFDGEAATFVGPSGLGKSSLCAFMAGKGFPFLADDGLEVRAEGDSVQACPSFPSIRLWQDSATAIVGGDRKEILPVQYNSKVRLPAGDQLPHCNLALPLNRLYFLGPGLANDVLVTPLAPQEALKRLLQNAFLLDIQSSHLMTTHFDHMARVVARVPSFELDYPRRYDVLDQVCESLLVHQTADRKLLS